MPEHWPRHHLPSTPFRGHNRPFLERLPAVDQKVLLNLGTPVTFAAGSMLMTEGHLADCVVILTDGQVKVGIGDGDGRSHLLNVQGAGDVVGDMSCVDGLPRSASVTALRDVRGVRIGRSAFLEVLRERQAVSMALLSVIAARLRRADRHRLELGNREVYPRLVRTIHDLSRNFLHGRGTSPVEIPLSQGEIAQLVNAAEVSVQRSLRDLRARKIINTGYRRVWVPCLRCLDLEGLSLGDAKSSKTITGCGGAGPHHPR